LDGLRGVQSAGQSEHAHVPSGPAIVTNSDTQPGASSRAKVPPPEDTKAPDTQPARTEMHRQHETKDWDWSQGCTTSQHMADMHCRLETDNLGLDSVHHQRWSRELEAAQHRRLDWSEWSEWEAEQAMMYQHSLEATQHEFQQLISQAGLGRSTRIDQRALQNFHIGTPTASPRQIGDSRSVLNARRSNSRARRIILVAVTGGGLTYYFMSNWAWSIILMCYFGWVIVAWWIWTMMDVLRWCLNHCAALCRWCSRRCLDDIPE